MAKNRHLILIAVFCLHLIAAVNLPQSDLAQSEPPAVEISTPVSTADGSPNLAVGLASSDCTNATIPVQNADFEQTVVELVNVQRAASNPPLPPLKHTENLSNASRYHAYDMLADVYFNHDSYDRANNNLIFACGVWSRVAIYYPFQGAGENIAAGFSTPESVMSAWMSSSDHRSNILNASFRELGIGFYTGDRGYWVQDFGYRDNVYPLVINGENRRTDNRSLSIYLYGKGVVSAYRIKDDASQWSGWLPFQEYVNWTLTGPGNATRTVTAELRKSSGEILTSSDTIYLDGQASLGNLPTSISFLYIRSTGTLSAANNILQPMNVGSGDILNWDLTSTGSWMDLSTASGSTPGTQVTVSIRNPAGLAPGTYSGTLTFTVTAPVGVTGSPLTIPARLIVVDALDKSIFLPSVLR